MDSVDGFIASCPSDIAPVHNSDANQDGGNCGRVVPVSLREGLLPSRSVMNLPPPLPQTAEENTVSTDSDMEMEENQKIKSAHSILIVGGGPLLV